MAILHVLTRPIISDNPVSVQILGLCSALAVTQSLMPALIMSIAVILVLGGSGFIISLLRRWFPDSIRLILEITIIASFVIIADEIIKTFMPEISRVLTVFVSLIVTNCIVLGRAETFARSHSPGISFLDGIGNGIGYSLILIMVGSVRELVGQGSLLDISILPLVSEGGWYLENQFMTQPASAFFVIGIFIWVIRSMGISAASRTQQQDMETDAKGGDEP